MNSDQTVKITDENPNTQPNSTYLRYENDPDCLFNTQWITNPVLVCLKIHNL